MNVTEEEVLHALSHVEEPDLKKDLVSLHMIEQIEITDNEISFTVILTTPACPLKKVIEESCRQAIHEHISSEIPVNIHMISRVTTPNKGSMFPNIKNIILVSSGKGGVGKSTVSANLALALSKKGAAVGLIDADIYGPSLPMMFQVEGAKPKQVMVEGKPRMQPIEKYGIKLLSIGFFTKPGQAIPWRGPMVSTAVKQLFNDAEWGELDYLVIDLPPGTGDIHITVSQTFPISGALIVTTPQKVSMADTAKGMAMFQMDKIEVPVLGIVENMAWFTPPELPDSRYYIFGKNGARVLAQQFEVPLLAEIPIMESVSDSGDIGVPIVLTEGHPVAAIFLELAEQVARQIAIRNATNPASENLEGAMPLNNK